MPCKLGLSFTGDARLVVPRLPDGDAAAVARDEDTVAQLEGAVAEWAALLAQVLQREQAAHAPGTGAQRMSSEDGMCCAPSTDFLAVGLGVTGMLCAAGAGGAARPARAHARHRCAVLAWLVHVLECLLESITWCLGFSVFVSDMPATHNTAGCSDIQSPNIAPLFDVLQRLFPDAV